MPPPKGAGELDHRVSIQALPDPPTYTPGGEQIETWKESGRRWAKYSPLSGDEAVAAQAVAAGTTGEVWLRYERGLTVTAKQRLVVLTLDSLVLNITAVLVYGRKEWWRVLVEHPQEQQVT
jgi:SPP1 family predicted phage head-tail adaptor